MCIGQHRIQVCWYNKKIGIKVDDATHAFIAEFVVPMMRDVLRKMAMNSEHRGAIVPTPSVTVPFPFPTPSVTGKISWHEPTNSWRIFTKEVKGNDKIITTTDLKVDKGLGSPARRRKYKEGCALWNNKDKSKRMRIPVRLDLDVAESARISQDQPGSAKK